MDYMQVTCATCRTKNQVPFVNETPPRCTQCKTHLPWIADAVDATFGAIANSTRVVVVVDLWASWSPPSRPLGLALERIAAERAGRMKLVKVNVEDARRVQSRLDARLIPTALILSGGEELGRQTGSPPLPQIRRWVDSALAKAAHANKEV
jgi:thioredoxin 2